MPELNDEGQQIAADLAQRYAMSLDAILLLFDAIAVGRGKEAQFSHPDLGGEGRWTLSGKIQIGDMFNKSLRTKVDDLCNEISELVHSKALFASFASSPSLRRTPPADQSPDRLESQESAPPRERGSMGMSFVVGSPPSAERNERQVPRTAAEPSARVAPAPQAAPQNAGQNIADDVLALIERLADLRRKDIITEEEFAAKKAELLARL